MRTPLYAVKFSTGRDWGYFYQVWIFEGTPPTYERLRWFIMENDNLLGGATPEIVCKWKSKKRFFKRLRRPKKDCALAVYAGKMAPRDTPPPAPKPVEYGANVEVVRFVHI